MRQLNPRGFTIDLDNITPKLDGNINQHETFLFRARKFFARIALPVRELLRSILNNDGEQAATHLIQVAPVRADR